MLVKLEVKNDNDGIEVFAMLSDACAFGLVHNVMCLEKALPRSESVMTGNVGTSGNVQSVQNVMAHFLYYVKFEYDGRVSSTCNSGYCYFLGKDTVVCMGHLSTAASIQFVILHELDVKISEKPLMCQCISACVLDKLRCPFVSACVLILCLQLLL